MGKNYSGEGDSLTEKGANRLKETIENYWASRGYDVKVNMQDGPFTPTARSARTDLRSNMKNGFPVRRLDAR